MKSNRALLSIIIAIAVTLGCASMALGQTALDRGAKVIRLKGSARFTTGNYAFQPIKVGQVLQPGTVVQTSADEGSYVDLVLGDGNATVPQRFTYRPGIVSSMAPAVNSFRPSSEQNVVRIWGDSALGIDKLTAMNTGADVVSETELDLKRGRLSGNVKKLPAGSKFEVKLPNGIAGVRGTLFDIQAAGIVKVFIGSLVVAWVDPNTQNVSTQTVMGGQSYDAPQKQISLLSPEAINAFEELSLSLVLAEFVPTSTSLASDRTLIEMSPVGAKAGSIPTAGSPPPSEGGVIFTFNNGPGPVTLPPPPRPVPSGQ